MIEHKFNKYSKDKRI